ncbi:MULTISPECIES: DNA translocase FtsK [unclassified Clostridium]|uniref:FtsK/SpoIIIE family DNA translocase n=2 Tax=Clostridium TaxID=1485 RepID=UPI00033C9E65|nr:MULTISPECIES: DNA translocase FtsK [unclassified Clostridium]MEE0567479.1 DNA translocase FtsK [Clostridium sp.]OKZ86198.1 MAG: cell division protein FtsK [Clostridium sp. 29_15]CDB75444.1 cell divisionFtsK/SpoIIIE [Clostridium sp. CAG:265]
MAKNKKKPMNKKNTNENSNNKTDIKGIILISLGLILALAIYTNFAGALSIFARKIIFNLIGILSLGLPIYLIYFGINLIKFKSNIKYARKIIGITVIYVIIGLFFATVKIQTVDSIGFSNTLRDILSYDGFNIHGGLLCHIIAYPLSMLVGFLGAYIFYITFAIISSVLLMDITLYEVYTEIVNKFKSRKKAIRKFKSSNKKASSPSIAIDDSSEDKFIKDINNKIKILDFMRNSEIKDNVDTLPEINIHISEEDNTLDEYNVELFNNIKHSSTKHNKGITESEKNVVTKEIDTMLNTSKENSIKIYTYPKLDLLNNNAKSKMKNEDKQDLFDNANKLEDTLMSFGVEAKVLQVTKGPSVTRFEIQPSPGVKVSKIVNLQDDIALGLAASAVRMEAPIPGKSAIGIEVPNKKQTPVFLREVLDSKEFQESTKKISFALGKDITGTCIVGDLSEMPHMLIAGATGSGKSVCINSLIVSLLYKYSPDEIKLLMIDPKVVELSIYNGIPHLLIPVVTEPKKAAGALNWAVNEMDKRYELFTKYKVKNIKSYNQQVDKGFISEKLPYIVLIVDELADLMMTCPNDVEDYICRLAQKARAAGIHLIIATQRPSVDVITGVIKANIPSRISFAVSSGVDSRTILDQTGAEKLLGRGDMLYSPMGANKPLRIQGAFISEEEVENVVDFIKSSEDEVNYREEIIEHINNENLSSSSHSGDSEENDELLDEAIKLVVEYQQASTSFIQRKLRIGFNRASRIMEELEAKGIISERDGSKPRQVLIAKDEIYNEQ